MAQTPPSMPQEGQGADEPSNAAGVTAQPGLLTPPEEVSAADFAASYGESIERALDLDTWERGENLDRMFARLDREISEALAREDELYKQIRSVVFPQIAQRRHAPPEAGVVEVTADQLKAVQQQALFNGAVEASYGTSTGHDTLPMSTKLATTDAGGEFLRMVAHVPGASASRVRLYTNRLARALMKESEHVATSPGHSPRAGRDTPYGASRLSTW